MTETIFDKQTGLWKDKLIYDKRIVWFWHQTHGCTARYCSLKLLMNERNINTKLAYQQKSSNSNLTQNANFSDY